MSRASIRARVAAMAIGLGGLAWVGVGGAPATAFSGKAPRCEKVTVKGQQWGVYVERGRVSCATAGTVLKGLLAGKGNSVDKGPANSYVLYDGWLCPYDQMGIATCYGGTRPARHPRRVIFGLSCATGTGEPGCPSKGEA